jgi:hypothetical protein
MLKTVTLQEANGLLPLVREHFLRIHILLAHLHHLRSKSNPQHRAHFIFDQNTERIQVIKKIPTNKKIRHILKKSAEVQTLIENEINELMRLGAVIKGLFPPHIDFLSLRNNEPIFLCWHQGESEITHWHQLDDGSPLRQIIVRKAYFGPHVVH